MDKVTSGHGGTAFVEGQHRRHLVGDGLPAEDGRVCPFPTDGGPDRWLVSGYTQTRDLLRDRRLSRAALTTGAGLRGPATRMSITDMDPPRHTEVRRLVSGAFSARRVAALRGHVEREAEELLERLLATGPSGDLLADFCAPLTFAAQSELLGVPASWRTVVRDRANARLGGPGTSRAEVFRGELKLHGAVTAMLDDTGDPVSGLLGELVSAHRDHGLLSREDLTGLAASLFFDGHALAAVQIANTVLCVLGRPGLLPRMAEDAELRARVADEGLRFAPAVTMSMARIATADIEIDGVRIKRDDLVHAALPLGNRDDSAYTRPDDFDPDRAGARHLSFGHGTHHCIGSHLALVEVQSALRALARRTPRLRLAVAAEDLRWTVTSSIRRLASLPVRWNVGDRRQSPARAA